MAQLQELRPANNPTPTNGRGGTQSGAELLTLSGRWFAAISRDGSRIVTGETDFKTAVVYDSRPTNRVFVRLPPAPPPRPAGR